jgi:hypothetical protein
MRVILKYAGSIYENAPDYMLGNFSSLREIREITSFLRDFGFKFLGKDTSFILSGANAVLWQLETHGRRPVDSDTINSVVLQYVSTEDIKKDIEDAEVKEKGGKVIQLVRPETKEPEPA